jgi:hypothetical protein
MITGPLHSTRDGGLSAPRAAFCRKRPPPEDCYGKVKGGWSALRAGHSLGGPATQGFTLQGPGFPNLYLAEDSDILRLTSGYRPPFTLQ